MQCREDGNHARCFAGVKVKLHLETYVIKQKMLEILRKSGALCEERNIPAANQNEMFAHVPSL